MKKLLFSIFCALIVTVMVTVSTASAGVLDSPNGYFGLKYLDATFTDFDYQNLFADTGLTYHPDQDPNNISNNVWGITALSSSHTLTDSNPENNALSGVSYYNPGSDGNYYFGVYGGLTLNIAGDTVDGTADGRTGVSVGSLGEIHLTATSEGAYLKIYEVSAADMNSYDLDLAAGPNVSGEGAFNTFGLNIISNGTLFLDLAFSPGTLAAYSTSYLTGDLELITLNSSVTGSAESYMDVIGGTGAGLVLRDFFPSVFPLFADRADLKVISDLTSDFNPVDGWGSAWTTTSQDPITGAVAVIPEPSTLLLLGCGLLGLVFCGRRRRSQ